MNEETNIPSVTARSSAAAGYATFMERGRGWEQCSVSLSKEDANKHTAIRRRLEKTYPMGKRFKTERLTHNEVAE